MYFLTFTYTSTYIMYEELYEVWGSHGSKYEPSLQATMLLAYLPAQPFLTVYS
jgi:hypothetical protein